MGRSLRVITLEGFIELMRQVEKDGFFQATVRVTVLRILRNIRT